MPVLIWHLAQASVPFVVLGSCHLVAGRLTRNPAKALRHRTCRLQAYQALHTINSLGEGIGGFLRRFRAVSASTLPST
tara:strand:- start:3078 stop:3311 length:234 start_codon:yes stop_codon:yes gene_type:complete